MPSRYTLLRDAPFALHVIDREVGRCAVVYRRQPNDDGRDRLQRLAALSPLAFSAGRALLRRAVAETLSTGVPLDGEVLMPGPYLPIDSAWGARVACYSLLARRLRDGDRLLRAAGHLQEADASQASWWLGLLSGAESARPLRALRILTEAVG